MKKFVRSTAFGLFFMTGLMHASFGAEKISQYLKNLGSSDPSERRVAVDMLGKSKNPQAVKPLMGVLKDADPAVRGAAADALGSLRASEAKNAVADLLLKDPDDEVRQRAAIALSSLADASLSTSLITALSDKDIGTKLAVIKTLGKKRIQQAAVPLAELLKDTNPTVREYSVKALGKINDKKSVPSVERMIDDPVPSVRMNAAYTLADMDSFESVPKLMKLLSDKEDAVRLAGAYALGRLKDTAGLAIAAQFIGHAHAPYRRQAVEIYGVAGSPDDCTKLETLEKNDSDEYVRRAAKQAINAITSRTPQKQKKAAE